jgi:hypothetical protein
VDRQLGDVEKAMVHSRDTPDDRHSWRGDLNRICSLSIEYRLRNSRMAE